MPEVQANRTLVKSPPELWAELSDAETLARHLADFGEIRITRVEPESAVAWEGERARGTVEIAASGWGTRVKLTAVAPDPEPEAGPEPPPPAAGPFEVEPPEPDPRDSTVASTGARPSDPRPRLFARLFPRRSTLLPAEPQTQAPPSPPASPRRPEPVPTAAPTGPEAASGIDPGRTEAVLNGVLDDLGAAHHRPFSRG